MFCVLFSVYVFVLKFHVWASACYSCCRFGNILEELSMYSLHWINMVLTGRLNRRWVWFQRIVLWWCEMEKRWYFSLICLKQDGGEKTKNLGLILDVECNFFGAVQCYDWWLRVCCSLCWCGIMYLFSTRSVWPNVCSPLCNAVEI